MQISAYVTYRELFGQVTEGDLQRFAAAISVEDFVASLGKLTWALERDPVDVQRQLAACLPRAALRRLQRNYGAATMAFHARFMRVVRLALEFGQRSEARGLSTAVDCETFVRAILGVADIYDDDEALVARNPDEWLVSMQLRQGVHRVPHRLLATARIWHLFVELPPRLTAIHHEVALADLPARFAAEVGLTPERYLAICAAIVTPYETWDKTPENWAVSAEAFASTRVTNEDFGKVTADLAADVDTLGKLFREDSAAGRTSLWDAARFARYPLCELRPGIFLPLSPGLLYTRLVGDGFYWRIRSLYSGERDGAAVFGAGVGRCLEVHLREVAVSAYKAAGAPGRLFGEIPFDGTLGTDLAIAETDQLILIEIGAGRVRYDTTVLQGRLDSLKNDAERLVSERGTQLARKISAVRDGRLGFAGLDVKTTVIRPVVVLLEGFPRGPGIDPLVDGEIEKIAGLLGDDILPLTILSAEEFEAAMSYVERTRRPLGTLLRDWEQDRIEGGDLRAFVEHRRGIRPVPACMEACWERLGDVWLTQLGFSNPGSR